VTEHTTTPAGGHAPPTPAERRAYVRYRCERPAVGRAFFSNTFKSLAAQIVDLSVGGIGLVLDQPLEAGTRLNVELDADTPFEIVAEVKNSILQADGKWRCGCELVWKLSEDELRFLLK
jgi:PilZ domain